MGRMGHQLRRVAHGRGSPAADFRIPPGFEVVAKLTTTEFKQVVDIVAAIADCFLTGTLASLESQRSLPQPEPAVDISTNAASDRPAVRIKPDAEIYAKRASAGLRGSAFTPIRALPTLSAK
jgi:hypothetical protein